MQRGRSEGHDAESLLGQSGVVGQLKKQLMERMPTGELTQHLRAEAEAAGGVGGNHRDGTSPKTVAAGEDTLALNMALRNIAKKWTIMPHRFWRPAANQITIMFGERFTRPNTDR